MDGLSFLAKLMKHYPLPVVVLSSLTPKNSELALKALDLGAVEVLCKPGAAYQPRIFPGHGACHPVGRSGERQGGSGQRPAVEDRQGGRGPSGTDHPQDHRHRRLHGRHQSHRGGAPAHAAHGPGIVIVQHMPEHFTTSFAKRLDEIGPLEVREARDNDHVIPGVALIAPGNHHMLLARSGGTYLVKIKNGPAFTTSAERGRALSFRRPDGRPQRRGRLLTGMGADGARGLLALRESGGPHPGPDEASCVVFGMPKEAIKLGAADEVVALAAMTHSILQALQAPPNARRAVAGG